MPGNFFIHLLTMSTVRVNITSSKRKYILRQELAILDDFKKLIKQVDKFNNLSLANSYAERSNKIRLIILGDDGKYWVSSPAVTEQLHKMGYEYA